MSDNSTIFAGPSIYSLTSEIKLSLNIRPPITDGNLYDLEEASTERNRVLIIDGMFGAGQAINLTEIRSFLSKGNELWGSTSMGALRAVEARPLGMRGTGRIFREYLSGFRVDDSDVALVHSEDGMPLSVPLVNAQFLIEMIGERGLSMRRVEYLHSEVRRIHFTKRDLASMLSIVIPVCDSENIPIDDLLSPQGLLLWDAKLFDADRAIKSFLFETDNNRYGSENAPTPLQLSSII